VTLLAFGNGAPDVFSALSAVLNMKNDDVGLLMGALLGIIYDAAFGVIYCCLEFLVLVPVLGISLQFCDAVGWVSRRTLIPLLYGDCVVSINRCC